MFRSLQARYMAYFGNNDTYGKYRVVINNTWLLTTQPGKWYIMMIYKGNNNMMTPSNGNIFRVTGPWWWESTGDRWIPLSKASDAELWCVFYLRLNKRLTKQSRHRRFETPSRSLWRHPNVMAKQRHMTYIEFENNSQHLALVLRYVGCPLWIFLRP